MKLNKMLDSSFKTLKKLVCENFGLIAIAVLVILVLNYQKVKSMAYELVGMETERLMLSRHKQMPVITTIRQTMEVIWVF